MQNIINKLINKIDITEKEAESLLEAIMREELSPVQTAMVLTALKMKGETVDEITAFITALRRHIIQVNGEDGVDVCGTGGDGKGTFNISTAVAFVLASAGVKVAKHGNRAASSKSGSADVLEAIGMKIDLNAKQTEAVLQKTNMVFLFAPLFHPAYKPVAIVRKELKIPTIFNYLGPFINPAGVKRQLIGVSNPEMAGKMAQVSQGLNYQHLIIASSDDGLDEVSIFAPSNIFEIKGKSLKKYKFNPEKYFRGGKFANIAGGDAKFNAEILKNIFAGEKGEKRDIVLVNSAFSFMAADKVRTIKEGIDLAARLIDSGLAAKKMEEVIRESNRSKN